MLPFERFANFFDQSLFPHPLHLYFPLCPSPCSYLPTLIALTLPPSWFPRMFPPNARSIGPLSSFSQNLITSGTFLSFTPIPSCPPVFGSLQGIEGPYCISCRRFGPALRLNPSLIPIVFISGTPVYCCIPSFSFVFPSNFLSCPLVPFLPPPLVNCPPSIFSFLPLVYLQIPPPFEVGVSSPC